MVEVLFCLINLWFFGILFYLHKYSIYTKLCCHFSSGVYLSFVISIDFSASVSMSFVLYGIIPGALYDAVPLILSVILLLAKSPAVSAVFWIAFFGAVLSASAAYCLALLRNFWLYLSINFFTYIFANIFTQICSRKQKSIAFNIYIRYLGSTENPIVVYINWN